MNSTIIPKRPSLPGIPVNGGLIEGKLEPPIDASLLDELENWSEQLTAKPEIAERLQAFMSATKNENFEQKSQIQSAPSELDPIRRRQPVRRPSQ